MNEKSISISYEEYDDISLLCDADRELVAAAKDAMNNAYAPYSHFHVGAAVRMSGGEIVKGANQENAAFPSGICAERTAMFSAAATYPDKDICSIAIVGGVHGRLVGDPVTPCGACRQVMAQYQAKSGKPITILMVGETKIWKFKKVNDILPLIFNSI